MTNTLGIMLQIFNNYPGTRLAVRIMGAIKRQVFLMVTHVFITAISHKKLLQTTPVRHIVDTHCVETCNSGCLKKFVIICCTQNAFSGYIYLMCKVFV